MTRSRTNATYIATLACMLTVPFAAHAQERRPVELGVMAGAAIPIALLSDAARTGWNVGAFVSFSRRSAPLSFRMEGQWMQLTGKQEPAFVACPAQSLDPGVCTQPLRFDFRVIDATANAVYTIPSALTANFYVIAGAGVYGERATLTSPDRTRSSSTKFGLNAGAGVKFRVRTLGAFLEARYHNIIHGSDTSGHGGPNFYLKSLQFIPINAGISF
jgi:hypothetical protein